MRLLKVLLLVKHVDGFPTTPHNLRILLTDQFDMDVMELERNIKYVPGELEKDTYVQRVGDTYNYLTNEEQDIEQEIKSTDIDSSKEIDELKKILVSDVLGKMTVAYGEQRAQFRYGLRIDGVQQSAQQPIWLTWSLRPMRRTVPMPFAWAWVCATPSLCCWICPTGHCSMICACT